MPSEKTLRQFILQNTTTDKTAQKIAEKQIKNTYSYNKRMWEDAHDLLTLILDMSNTQFKEPLKQKEYLEILRELKEQVENVLKGVNTAIKRIG